MNQEEKRKYEAFQYWIQTNTERGVTTIPDNLCLFIVNLIKSLQKENEELKIKNNAIKRESEAYAENMIRLDNELNLEKEKSKYEWIRQNCLSQELVNKLYIPVQKVKDKIEEYKNMCISSVDGYENYFKDNYNELVFRRMEQLEKELLESEE